MNHHRTAADWTIFDILLASSLSAVGWDSSLQYRLDVQRDAGLRKDANPAYVAHSKYLIKVP
ncbi:hypothetical protein OAF74_01750 [bacterium]|nr:hypothetical protein [bacterium]